MRSEIDQMVRGLINNGPFDPPDGPWEAKANVVLAGINDLKAKDRADALDIEELEEELRSIAVHILHAGDNPHDVPLKEIRYVLDNPVVEYPVSLKHRRAITGPGRAIRAKCMECQGLQQAWVHDCLTINCPLWPFRFGNNPFYGRLANTDENEEVVDSEAEIEALEAQRKPIGAASANPS